MNHQILVVEDDLIAAAHIMELLEEEGYQLLGPAVDSAAAVLLCEEANQWPDLILCDIHLRDGMKGVSLARELQQRFSCAVIFLTAYSDQRTLKAAMEANPRMYLVKPYTDAQLLVAVQMAFYQHDRDASTVNSSTLQITSREKEILQWIARGLSTRQIAQKMGVSAETIKTHRRNVLRKNNISSIPQLIYLMNQ